MGLATDGVSTFTGTHRGFGVLLSQELFGIDKPRKLYHVACLPHKLQLAARRVVDNVEDLEEFEQGVKNLANMYIAQNPKNVAHLLALADVEGMRSYRITYAFDVRWATSEYLVLGKLRESLALLLVALESLSVDNTFRSETRAKATGILRTIRKRSFILILFHLSDFMSQISSYSKKLQTSAASLIGQEGHRANLFRYVELSGEMEGKFLKQLLEIMECRTGPHSTAYHKCRSVDEIECSMQVRLLYGKALDKKVNLEDKDATTCSRAEPKQFEKLRREISVAMMNSLKHYFPEKQFQDFEILHPKNFNRDEMRLRSYGTTEIGNLATRFELDSDKVVSEFQNLMYDIAESVNYGVLVNLRPHQLWARILRDPDITMRSSIRKLIRTVLVIPASSADAERSFSYMNIIKTSRRGNLKEQTLDDLLRITLNGPPITQFDASMYAKKWKSLHTNDPASGGGRPRKRPITPKKSTVSDGRLFTPAGSKEIQESDAQLEQREIVELEFERELDDQDIVFFDEDDDIGNNEPLFPTTIF